MPSLIIRRFLRVVLLAATAVGCSRPAAEPELIIYSGRSEDLIGPVVERFRAETGLRVVVRYGGTAEMAAIILEEGPEGPADVYYGQDAGSLGALAKEKRLRPLPASILERVEPRFRARDGTWVGTSGRARVVVYNTDALSEQELPDTVSAFSDIKWKGRIGWAPPNGSFQSFVTAMIVSEGKEATRAWLDAMIENESNRYPDNRTLFEAVVSGEVPVGLTNHYYLFRFLEEADGSLPVRNYSPRGGGAGALVNIAGAGILDSAKHDETAERFIAFLLSRETQTYFAEETFEYPLVEGVRTHPLIEPLSEITTPDIDLADLDDLRGTLALLREAGAL